MKPDTLFFICYCLIPKFIAKIQIEIHKYIRYTLFRSPWWYFRCTESIQYKRASNFSCTEMKHLSIIYNVYSLFFMTITGLLPVLQKVFIKIVAYATYTHFLLLIYTFFLYKYSSLLLQNKNLLWSLFSSAN